MKHSRAVPILVAATLALLPLLYAGSYAALIDSSGRLVMNDDGICRVRPYRYGGRVAEVVYWPIRQIDRQLRELPD